MAKQATDRAQGETAANTDLELLKIKEKAEKAQGTSESVFAVGEGALGDAALVASAETILSAPGSVLTTAAAVTGASSSGLSTNQWLGIGAGVVAAGAGIGIAASSGGGGGDAPAPAPTVAVTQSATTISEGSTAVTYTVNTTGYASGAVLSYTISGVQQDDINQPLSGTVVVDANGVATLTVSALADGNVGEVEAITFTVAGQSVTTAITDTTPAPTVAVTQSADTISEGSAAVTYTVNTTGYAAGAVLSYTISGVQQDDINQPLSGTVVVDANGVATLTVSALADGNFGEVEAITFTVAGQSVTTAITDTTPPPAQGLSVEVDTIVGTDGDDVIVGRAQEFQSFDRVDGGAGVNTLNIIGPRPEDANAPMLPLSDAAFENTSNIQNVIVDLANVTLGANAAAAGVGTLTLGGIGATGQDVDIRAFDSALTVNGSGRGESVRVDLASSGAKTLNMGKGADLVEVTPSTAAAAGSIQVNFASGAVGNGTNDSATIVNAAGNVVVNDEGTVIRLDNSGATNVFNVVGLDANGVADPAQNRGNFASIVLGTEVGGQSNDGVSLFTFSHGNGGNVYINAGAGDDQLRSDANFGQRHFLVGGTGDDFFITSGGFFGGETQVIGGEGADVLTDSSSGVIGANMGAGDDVVDFTFGSLVINAAAGTAGLDTLNGGDGLDTLIGTSGQLANLLVPTVRTVSGFETITVADQLFGGLVTGNVQAGITTVNLEADVAPASFVTFDGGFATTLNLGAAVSSTLDVRAAGTATNDTVTIANTAAAQTVAPNVGVATDAFGGQAITTAGVETLIIDSSALGTAATQTIFTIDGTTLETVNFVGSNEVTADVVSAQTINAAGLTGSASLTAETSSGLLAATEVGSVTGSANGDTITLGSDRQNVALGAGDDTLIVLATNDLAAGTSTLAGGEGIDTLQTTGDIAATLSVANRFNSNLSGFEVLSLADGDSDAVNASIRLDNLGVNTVISDGTAANLVLQNLVSTGTLRLTGASAGSHQVTVLGSGSATNDVLNLQLVNESNTLRAFGTVLVANTETVNISTADTGLLADAAATRDTLDLDLQGAAPAAITTTITVSGNNGLDLTLDDGNQRITRFDASGVVADDATDSLASLAVNFTSANTTSAVTIIGGAGSDALTGNSTVDTISGGGGDDTIFGAAGNDVLTGGEGTDTITGGLGADTINLAEVTAVSDVVVVAAGDSTRLTIDVVSGFDTAASAADATADVIRFLGAGNDAVVTDINGAVTDGFITGALLTAAQAESSVTAALQLIEGEFRTAAAGAQNGVFAFEYSGSTYVATVGGADGSEAIADVVRLVGVTGATTVFDLGSDVTIG